MVFFVYGGFALVFVFIYAVVRMEHKKEIRKAEIDATQSYYRCNCGAHLDLGNSEQSVQLLNNFMTAHAVCQVALNATMHL